MSPPILAVLLDRPDLEQAVETASRVSEFVDWFCVGSTLIKKEGMRAVKAVSLGSPERELFADLRASAGAGEEASMAFQAGADIVSVAFLAKERSCREAVGVAKTFGGKVVFDLYGAPNPVVVARRGLELGFDYLYFHAEGGVSRWWESYRRIAGSVALPIIFEGEVEFREFPRVMKLSPAVVVVGKAITEAEDPASSAARFGEVVHGRRAA